MRSYPLHWGEDEYSKEDTPRVAANSNQKKDEYNKEETITVTVKRPERSKETQEEDFPICVLLGWKEDFVIQEALRNPLP